MWVELFVWSTRVNAIVSFLMVALLLFSRPLTKVKILWAGTCVSVGLWSAGLTWMSSMTKYSPALLGSEIVSGTSVFIPVLFFHTVQSLLKQKENRWTAAFYFSAILLNILNLKGLLIDVRPAMGFAYYTLAKPLYVLFVLHLYSGFAYVCWVLWKAAQQSPPMMKKQLMSLFWGAGLGFVGGQMTVPLVYGIKIFPWGVFFVPLYVLFVGYAMLRYQFMDFKLALRKLGLTMGIYLCLLIVTLPLSWTLFRSILNYPPHILFHLLLAVGLLTFILAAGPFIYALVLRRTYWLKSHFTMGLTHELKSPLANISGAADFLSEHLSEPSLSHEKLEDYTQMIRRNVVRLESFINDLLNIAAIQEGNVSIDRKSVHLAPLAQEVAESFKPLLEQKKIRLELNLDSHSTINGDADKLRQVISNLLSNALKFSKGGQIRILIRESEGEVLCAISDEGDGIAPKNLKKIFDRFYQGEKGQTQKGSGIGLAIAKAWVEAHGGKIWAESEGEGKGTTVTFTLPV